MKGVTTFLMLCIVVPTMFFLVDMIYFDYMLDRYNLPVIGLGLCTGILIGLHLYSLFKD